MHLHNLMSCNEINAIFLYTYIHHNCKIMEEDQDSTDEEGTNLEVRTVKKFHGKRMRGLGLRKDRAKNAAQVLNRMLGDGLNIRQTAEKTGLSEGTIYNILRNPTIRSEIRKYSGLLSTKALGNLSAKIDSKDEKVSIQASKYVLNALESLEQKQSTSTAPVIDMTALVSSVASNLLAGAMLGIRSTLQDNSRSPATGTDEVQVLSTSMGSTSTVQSSTVPEDQYIDPEVLHVPDDDVPI